MFIKKTAALMICAAMAAGMMPVMSVGAEEMPALPTDNLQEFDVVELEQAPDLNGYSAYRRNAGGSSEDLAFLKKTRGTYGYNDCLNSSDGESRAAFYDKLWDIAADYWMGNISYTSNWGYNYIATVSYSSYGLSEEAAEEVYNDFLYDNTCFFFLKNGVLRGSGYFYLWLNDEYLDASVKNDYQDQVIDFVTSTVDTAIADSWCDYEISYSIMKELNSKMTYSYSSPGVPNDATWAHNIMGPILYGEGVCESYSKTYQALMTYAGMDCIYVKGTGNGGGHAWNAAKMDNGSYYYIDTTWNDSWGGTYYFAEGTTKFLKDHAVDSSTVSGFERLYPMPSVPAANYTHTAHTYSLGDVNCDGKVNNKDVVIIARYYNNSSTRIKKANADFDKNGSINLKDAVAVARSILS